jgi:PAS domain S-box-containing protein
VSAPLETSLVRALLDNAPILVVLRNMDGEIIYANKRSLEVLSPPDQTTSDHGRAVIPESAALMLDQGAAEVHRTGMPWSGDVDVATVGGAQKSYRVDKFPVRTESGEIGAFGSIWTDLSDVKEAEVALRASRQRADEALTRLHAVLAAISEYGVAVVDADGRMELMNPAAERMWGYPAQEVIGTSAASFFETLTALSSPEFSRRRWQSGYGVGVPPTLEVDYRRKDGSTFPVAVTSTPLFGPAGETTGHVGVVRDLTETRRRESELVAARDDARRANDAKDEFVGRMSHELRTPLNAILGFSQLLERSGLQANHREWVANILTAGRLLLSLVNEVLDLAQVASGKLQLSLEPVDAGALIEDVLVMVEPLARDHKIRIVNDVDGRPDAAVRADRRRLGQILTNLLTNAVKYNQPGGEVRIRVSDAGGLVRLSVTDTGPGIDAAGQARLFLPFDRLGAEASMVEGTGLGLAVTKALAEAQGGEVGVESRVGHGSTFWVEFPRSQHHLHVAAAPALSVTELPAPAAGPPRVVLYVEDNPVNVRLVETILADRPDLELLVARTGSLGLELAMAQRPALILLDLHLPDLDGEQVLAQLHEMPGTADIPVVVLSADANPKDIDRLRRMGASDYLSKPFVIEQLLAVLRDLVSRDLDP